MKSNPAPRTVMSRWPSAAALASALVLSACETTKKEESESFEFTDAKTESILDSRLRKLEDDAAKYPKRDDLHYQMAGIYFEKAAYRESATALHRAIELSPEQARYHFQLGRVHLRMNELDGAEAEFREAVRLTPRDRFSGPRAALGYVLSLKKDNAGAVEQFRRCTEIEPENPFFYYALGAQYDLLGRSDDAIRCFREYLERGGTTYRRNAVFLLDKLGVKVENLPPPGKVREGADRLGDFSLPDIEPPPDMDPASPGS